MIYGDGWVLPFSELDGVDYTAFSVLLAERDAPHTAARLRAIGSDARVVMQAAGRAVYRRYFERIDGQVDAVAAILRARAEGRTGRYQTPDGGTVQCAPPQKAPLPKLTPQHAHRQERTISAARRQGPTCTHTRGVRSTFRKRS